MSKFDGFHGTSSDAASKIIKDNYSYSKESEWFGSGVYFFETIRPLYNGFN